MKEWFRTVYAMLLSNCEILPEIQSMGKFVLKSIINSQFISLVYMLKYINNCLQTSRAILKKVNVCYPPTDPHNGANPNLFLGTP